MGASDAWRDPGSSIRATGVQTQKGWRQTAPQIARRATNHRELESHTSRPSDVRVHPGSRRRRASSWHERGDRPLRGGQNTDIRPWRLPIRLRPIVLPHGGRRRSWPDHGRAAAMRVQRRRVPVPRNCLALSRGSKPSLLGLTHKSWFSHHAAFLRRHCLCRKLQKLLQPRIDLFDGHKLMSVLVVNKCEFSVGCS